MSVRANPPHTGRRSFLWKTAALSGLTVAAPLRALEARTQEAPRAAAGRGKRPDYGPLYPTIDGATGLPLLQLPKGFRYVSFGWTGDPLVDGTPTPGAHDGMAAFPFRGGRIRLVRNHEVGPGDAFDADLAYDPKAGGGTTTLEFNTFSGQMVKAWGSIAGTLRNCAGGPTPWGSWISGEETIDGPAAQNGLTQPHGYAFEVPVVGTAAPEPIRDMGRASRPTASSRRASPRAVRVSPGWRAAGTATSACTSFPPTAATWARARYGNTTPRRKRCACSSSHRARRCSTHRTTSA